MTETLLAPPESPTETRFVSLENESDWCASWVAAAPMGAGVLTPFGVVDPDLVSPDAAIDMLIGLDRLKNWVEAQQVRYLDRLSRRPATLPMHSGAGTPKQVGEAEVIKRGFLREEIALALRRSSISVQNWMDTAVIIAERLPAT